MNLVFLFFTGLTIGIAGAMIPGPLTLFTVSEVLKSNRFAGLKIISGHIAFEFALIWLVISRLRVFVDYAPFLTAISVIGGIALIIMGVILILTSPKMEAIKRADDPGFNRGLFLGGIFFSIISPGFIAWWATIGLSTIIRAMLSGMIGVAILTLGHWLAIILWYWSISYAVDKGKSHLSNRKYRNIIRFFAVLLITLGITFIASFAYAEENNAPPPGMRIEKIGDLEIMVPIDAKVERTGKGGLISVEKTEEYVSRKLLEVEERFKSLEEKQKELEGEVAQLKEVIHRLQKNDK